MAVIVVCDQIIFCYELWQIYFLKLGLLHLKKKQKVKNEQKLENCCFSNRKWSPTAVAKVQEMYREGERDQAISIEKTFFAVKSRLTCSEPW